MTPEVRIRRGGEGDWASVALIHAASWRSAYRGIYPDDWLDDEVVEERRSFWRDSLAAMDPEQDAVFLAEEDGRPVGFACLRREAEPGGPFLDNLHVLPDRKGQGLGRRLIGAAVSWLMERDPNAPLHLVVWKANRPARAFYARFGGVEVEEFQGILPNGGTAPEIRVRWERAADLAGLA